MDKSFFLKFAGIEYIGFLLPILIYGFVKRKEKWFGLTAFRKLLLLVSGYALLLLLVNYLFLFNTLHIHNKLVFLFYGFPLLLLILSTLIAFLPKTFRINLIVLIVFILILEGVFFMLGRKAKPDMQTKWIPDVAGTSQTMPSEITGFIPRPEASGRIVKTVKGDTIYDVQVGFDALSRRVIPGFAANPDSFLLCFGGSRTFGEGVNDDETMPYFLSNELGIPNAYSYSFRGWGPAQFLSILQSRALEKEVKGKKGTFVFFMIDSHIRRTAGTYFVASRYNGGYLPNYVKGKDGSLVRKRMFVNGRPAKALVYSLLSMSKLFNFFVKDLPLKPKDFELTADVLAEIKAEVSKKVELDRFVVFFHPGNEELEPMMPLLNKRGIEYHSLIDLFPFAFDQASEYVHSEWDTHLNAKGNAAVARAMAEALDE